MTNLNLDEQKKLLEEMKKEDEKKEEVHTKLIVHTSKEGMLVGSTIDEQYRIAQAYLRSKLFPKSFDTPEKIMVAMQFCFELGLKPITGARNICVINGTPSLWGDTPMALVQDSGKLEDFKERWFDRDGKNTVVAKEVYGYECVVKRKELPTPVVRSFTMDDARQAGLLGKDTWQKYPMRMLQCRARSWALKDLFPDCLKAAPIAEYDYNQIPDKDGNVKRLSSAESIIEKIKGKSMDVEVQK